MKRGSPRNLRTLMKRGVLTPPLLDLEGYQECLARCRDQFPDLKILSGVELSEPHWHRDRAADLLQRGSFDLVVCGLHSLRHGPDVFVEVSEEYHDSSGADVVRGYLAGAVQMIDAWDDFEVLAHIDYPVRTWRGQQPAYRAADFEEEYRQVLRHLACSGRVLEFNTRVPLDRRILGWWRDEGGSAVSFGSDAHDPLMLASGFTDAAAVAEASGFCSGKHHHDYWTRS
jgi:histidinol-phosphatase (PHP family)